MNNFIIALSLCLLGASCQFTPGGGGSDQVVPDIIKAGEPAVIKLELSVWGSGGAIKGRYTDVSLHYRLVGEDSYKTLLPTLISQGEKREVYELTLPSYPKDTTGEVEYYFELKLDGHPSRVDGMKKIKIA